MSEDLKPCPFCGGKAQECDDGCIIECSICKIRTHPWESVSCVDDWNQRDEPLGNPDELIDSVFQRCQNQLTTIRNTTIPSEYYDTTSFRNGYCKALEWVLSLKREGKE